MILKKFFTLLRNQLRKKSIMSGNSTIHLGFRVIVDENSTFGNYVNLLGSTTVNNSKIGDCTYSCGTEFANCNIGKFCSIAKNTIIGGLGKHPTNMLSTHPSFYSPLKQCGFCFTDKSKFDEYDETNVGNDVWIGINSVILDGISIGDGAIVAAGSIVVNDVPPYAIVGGVPAKIIRYRYTDEKISQLLKLKWWDLDIKQLSYLKTKFIENDVDGLIDCLNNRLYNQ